MFILVFTKVTKIVFNHVYIYMHRLIFDVPKIQSEEELEQRYCTGGPELEARVGKKTTNQQKMKNLCKGKRPRNLRYCHQKVPIVASIGRYAVADALQSSQKIVFIIKAKTRMGA